MRSFIELTKADVDEFVAGRRKLHISEATRATLNPLSEQWVKYVDDAFSHFKILQSLTVGPVFDNQFIGSAAMAIDDDLKQLGKTLKQVYRLLQKEGKDVRHRQKPS